MLGVRIRKCVLEDRFCAMTGTSPVTTIPGKAGLMSDKKLRNGVLPFRSFFEGYMNSRVVIKPYKFSQTSNACGRLILQTALRFAIRAVVATTRKARFPRSQTLNAGGRLFLQTALRFAILRRGYPVRRQNHFQNANLKRGWTTFPPNRFIIRDSATGLPRYQRVLSWGLAEVFFLVVRVFFLSLRRRMKETEPITTAVSTSQIQMFALLLT